MIGRATEIPREFFSFIKLKNAVTGSNRIEKRRHLKMTEIRKWPKFKSERKFKKS